MGMDLGLKTELRSIVHIYGRAWEDPELQKRVYAAIDEDDIVTLIDIINDQALSVGKLKGQVRTLYKQVLQLESDKKAQIEQSVTVVSKSNAYRDDLDTEKMWELYQKERSYSKVGKLMGCDGKTVKRRLCAVGYIVS